MGYRTDVIQGHVFVSKEKRDAVFTAWTLSNSDKDFFKELSAVVKVGTLDDYPAIFYREDNIMWWDDDDKALALKELRVLTEDNSGAWFFLRMGEDLGDTEDDSWVSDEFVSTYPGFHYSDLIQVVREFRYNAEFEEDTKCG